MRINARTKVITILFDGLIREVVTSIRVVRVLSPRALDLDIKVNCYTG